MANIQQLKKIKKEEPSSKLNEYGDRIDRAGVCQGTLLFLGVLGVAFCAGIRGCQEIKKHQSKSVEKAKVIQLQNTR